MNFPQNEIDCGLLVQAHFLLRYLGFFCRQSAGTDILHQASTYQIDHRVRESAELVEDSLLLARHNMRDMVALVVLDAQYHAKCLLDLYNRARKVSTNEKKKQILNIKYLGLYLQNLSCT